ncbi:MAG: hypothetical protein DRG27_00605 [Deltaproteobacteria bacterium]|nr:MAG: hypothetical protein DRG27_00605 [Deltaproteobacteria bacterium]
MDLDYILRNILMWYKDYPDAVFYSSFLVSMNVSQRRLDKLLENATEEQLEMFDLIKDFEKTRLKESALKKDISTPFVMRYLDKVHNLKLEKDKTTSAMEEFESIMKGKFGLKPSADIIDEARDGEKED